MQKLKDSNKMLLIFKVKRKQTVRLGHNKKELNYKKEQQLSYAQQALSAVATRKWNRNGHISKGVKIHQSIR
jgi:hypothetical protein